MNRARRERSPRNPKRPQYVSTQSWVLGAPMYIVTGDLIASRCSKGGAPAQLNQFGVVLRMEVTENASFEIACDREHRMRAQFRARGR